ncbi:hypothetical protein Esi_0027_0082 [Ectocarpus siliculosus]|uniref:Uncharacterized protein n=1 Tax=Ectocarpus siliculosus TaxID=2880 RepID=D7FUD8_ECTSI|nr:hypothetical protein Esi_0027_0082 [Ectocarpus siliculosus]|eukprot:CBJ26208.1 hypothetical protein Esi_0027_0082 [Ectocarpus siliculosus]
MAYVESVGETFARQLADNSACHQTGLWCFFATAGQLLQVLNMSKRELKEQALRMERSRREKHPRSRGVDPVIVNLFRQEDKGHYFYHDDEDDSTPSAPGDDVANQGDDVTEEGGDATEEMPDVESQVQNSESEAPMGDEEAVLGAPEVTLRTALEPSATASFSTDGARDGRFVCDGEAIFAAGEAGMMSDERHTAVAAVVNAVVGETAATDEPTGAGFSVDTSPEDPERVNTRDGKPAEDRGQQVSRPEPGVVADVSNFCSWQELVLDFVTGTPLPPPSSPLGKGAPQPVMVNTFRQDKDDNPPDDATASVARHHVGDAAASDAAAAEAALLTWPISPEPTGTGFSISPLTWDPESASLSYAQSVSQGGDRGQQLPRAEANGVVHEADYSCSWEELVLNLVRDDDKCIHVTARTSGLGWMWLAVAALRPLWNIPASLSVVSGMFLMLLHLRSVRPRAAARVAEGRIAGSALIRGAGERRAGRASRAMLFVSLNLDSDGETWARLMAVYRFVLSTGGTVPRGDGPGEGYVLGDLEVDIRSSGSTDVGRWLTFFQSDTVRNVLEEAFSSITASWTHDAGVRRSGIMPLAGQRQDLHAWLTDNFPVAAAVPAPRLLAADPISTRASGSGRVPAVRDWTPASSPGVVRGYDTTRNRARRYFARAPEWAAIGEETAAAAAGPASTPQQQQEVVPLAGTQMPSAQQSPARAAPVVTSETARVSGRSSPSPKPSPAVTLPSRGRASAAAVVTNGVGADASGLEEANGVRVITAAAAAGPPARASGLRAPASAGATAGGDLATAGSASGPGVAFTMETGEVVLVVEPRSTSVSQSAVSAAPAAAAAAAATVVAGLAVASDGSAASSPLTGAGGIAGDRRKKAWQARKAARSVSAIFSEQPSRRQGKREAKRQEECRAKAGRERRSPAVQPGAEHGNSSTTVTAAIGGSGNAVPTAVRSKTLGRPAGRPEDLAISALNRVRRQGGARGATKGQRSSNKNAAGFDKGGGSGAKGAASPEPHARQEERGDVKVRKFTLQEWREENEGAEKKEEEQREKEEENGKEEGTERVNGRPASPQAPSGVSDQGATHAAASTDSEGRCYDKEVALSKKLLSLKEAESFLALNVPGVEGVYSMGQTIGISIRGDGNCFWTSCCLAVLLWALCQDCSQQLQDLLARYRAIRRGSRAHDALSLDMKDNVRRFVSFVEMLLDLKTTGISKPALVGTLVRSLSKRTERRHEGTFNAPLFKGMVLATRIAAMVFKVPSATPEIVDGFATVSNYTTGDMFDLRPCEFLGVRAGLVAEYLDPDGDLQTMLCNDETRKKWGCFGPVSTDLPLADGIALRKGALPHFDLRIETCSRVGIALAGALKLPQLTNEDGEKELRRRLTLETESQVELTLLSRILDLRSPPPVTCNMYSSEGKTRGTR